MTFSRRDTLTAAEHLRVDEIDRLAALGSLGLDELLATMSDPSWTVRRAGVAALAALGDDSTGPLCAWLRDRRTEEHSIAAAVDALATSNGGTTTPAVIRMLADPRPAIAADAARILGRRRAHEAVPFLARATAHLDANVAIAAIEALGEIGGTTATDELIAVVATREFFRSLPAIHVLARSSDPRAIGPIAGLLVEELYKVEAIGALGRTGSAHAVAPLAALLSGGDAAVTRLVVFALADLLARAEWIGTFVHVVESLRASVAPALARFLAALPTADRAARAALAVVLGRTGDAAVLPALAALLPDPDVHELATEAIQRICRAHDGALVAAFALDAATRVAALPVVIRPEDAPSVRALLDDESGEVRARACEALARIGDTSAVPALFVALGDPSPRISLAATAAIKSLATADTGPRAIAALGSGPSAVRRCALRILACVGSKDAFDVVRLALADPELGIAELAVAALAAVEDARVDGILTDLARSTTPTLRAAVMRAMIHRSRAGATEVLVRGVADAQPWVRYYACQGLGWVGGAQAVDLLVARLADATPYVRIAAIEALSLLDGPAAWQALCSVVRSSDADARRAALVGFGLRAREDSLPFLFDAAGSLDVATRLIALSGLAHRSGAAALDVVAAAVLDPIVEIRDAALSLLAERTDRPAAEMLVGLALACEPSHPVHLTLSRPSPARIAAMAASMEIADDRDASILAASLARVRDAAATTALFHALSVANPRARRAAATTLVAIGVEGARAAVATMAKDDPDVDVRRICAALVVC